MWILALLLIGAVAAVQWRAGVRERAAEAAYPPTGQLIDAGGTTVHAQVMGLEAGAGPDLVLIHGASGNLRDFTTGFAQSLAERYRIILFDRPGLGWTERPPGHGGAWNTSEEPPMEQAALLQQAADQLGVENPIVLGHSFGGAVALAWGLSRPDDTAAIVLAGSVSMPWPGELGLLYNVTSSAWGGALVVPVATAFLPASYIEGSVDSIFAPQQPPEGYAKQIGAALTLRRESTRANAQQVNYLRPHIVEMSKRYDTLRMPIEAVHGTADTIVPLSIHSRPFTDMLPNATLTELDGIGHMPQHAAPDALRDAIDRAAARAGLR